MNPVYHDNQYLELVSHVLTHGVSKPDRTGTGTKSVFGKQMRFDLSDDTIPLLTTKKMHIRSIIYELLWYLQGTGNIKYLKDNKVSIWDEWADENDNLGPVYGVQWRGWPCFSQSGLKGKIDQIAILINTLTINPDSRRMLINAWNVGDLDKMALPPCHYSFQFYTTLNPFTKKRSLSCLVNQRSCDIGLGVPFNIVQYSILLRMIARVVDMTPGYLIWSGGDVHIYNNHISALEEQLTRNPYCSPTLEIARNVESIDDFRFEDFVISGYESHPTLKMEVSV